MPTNRRYGEMAVHMGYLAQSRLERVLHKQRELKTRGKEISVRQLLEKSGLLTQEQISAVDFALGIKVIRKSSPSLPVARRKESSSTPPRRKPPAPRPPQPESSRGVRMRDQTEEWLDASSPSLPSLPPPGGPSHSAAVLDAIEDTVGGEEIVIQDDEGKRPDGVLAEDSAQPVAHGEQRPDEEASEFLRSVPHEFSRADAESQAEIVRQAEAVLPVEDDGPSEYRGNQAQSGMSPESSESDSFGVFDVSDESASIATQSPASESAIAIVSSSVSGRRRKKRLSRREEAPPAAVVFRSSLPRVEAVTATASVSLPSRKNQALPKRGSLKAATNDRAKPLVSEEQSYQLTEREEDDQAVMLKGKGRLFGKERSPRARPAAKKNEAPSSPADKGEELSKGSSMLRRMLKLVAVLCILGLFVCLVGLAYIPFMDPFRGMLKGEGAVANSARWWNGFAAESLGGKLYKGKERKPATAEPEPVKPEAAPLS